MNPTETNTDTRREVRRFRRRLTLLLVLERGLRFVAIAGFASGGVVLALRVGWKTAPGGLLNALAVVLLSALGLAVVEGLRALPAETAVRALLDRRQRRGGLLMADAEADLGAWRHRLAPAEAPRLRWRSGSAWTLVAGSAAFVTLSFLVPAPALDASTARRLDIGEEIAELEDDLEVLEQEGWLEGEEAERLELELETLAEDASGEDPARAWEALDHLRGLTEQKAREAAEAAYSEGERLAAASEVAQALDQGGAERPELEAEALEELASLAAQAADEGRLLDESLAEALARAARSGDLGQLLDALGDARAGARSRLERLHEAGLIDLETLLAAKKSLDAGDDALAAYLEENGLEAAGAYCRLAGRGGVTRGRADAEMTWGEESSRDGAGFEEQVLDPASLRAFEKSGLIGLQAADPAATGRQPLPAAGTSGLDPAAAGGGAAYTQTVLPRHRRAVRRFFERAEKAGGSNP